MEALQLIVQRELKSSDYNIVNRFFFWYFVLEYDDCISKQQL